MDVKSSEQTEKATQSYAALSVGFVCIIIGLPLWWKTTEVYRVQLPYSEIATTTENLVLNKVQFTIILFDQHIEKVYLNTLRNELQIHLNKEAVADCHIRYEAIIRQAYDEEKDVFLSSSTIEELDTKLSKQRILIEHAKYSIAILPESWNGSINSSVLVHTHRTAYIRSNPDALDLFKSINHVIRHVFVDEQAMAKSYQSAQGIRHHMIDKESMRAVRYHPGYEVTFTLINPQPDILKVTWDIKHAIADYLKPLLRAFETFTDITVKSQYLHYVGLSVRPKKDEERGIFTLTEDVLPHIINPIEGYLGSHVSTNPNLNFIVYVPTRDQAPLFILDQQGKPSKDNGFLSPRWGGLHVHNMKSPGANDSLPKAASIDMQHVMGVFISQLRMLIGISTVSSTQEIVISQPSNAGVTEWELDKWLRCRTLENIATSAATLKSLIQLLEEVGNIVINDEIGLEVTRALQNIQKTHKVLAEGQLQDAFLASRQAIISSEKAFFDPSLLELLYFPEDQKFAIYIPLFLPISIPIVLSIIQAIKWIRGKDVKQKTE